MFGLTLFAPGGGGLASLKTFEDIIGAINLFVDCPRHRARLRRIPAAGGYGSIEIGIGTAIAFDPDFDFDFDLETIVCRISARRY